MLSWPASPFDAKHLAANLRPSDIWETQFNCRMTGRAWDVEGEVTEAVRKFDTWSLWDGEDLVAVAGIAPAPENPKVGIIWFLGTRLADLRPVGMTKATRRFLNMQLPKYARLINMVPIEMTHRIEWLSKLGFDNNMSEAQQKGQHHVVFWRDGGVGPKDEPAAP